MRRFSRAEWRRLRREAYRRGDGSGENGIAFSRPGSNLARGSSLGATTISSSPIVGSSRRVNSSLPLGEENGSAMRCRSLRSQAMPSVDGTITGRSLGWDPSIEHIEHIPAHRFLWFEWGDAQGPIPHDMTLLGFGKDSGPVFVALRDVLERMGPPSWSHSSFGRKVLVKSGPLTQSRNEEIDALDSGSDQQPTRDGWFPPRASLLARVHPKLAGPGHACLVHRSLARLPTRSFSLRSEGRVPAMVRAP